MTGQEIRMRCIEAVAQTGVREPQRLIRDAKELEEFVLGADNGKPPAPGRKTADKA